MKKVIFTGNNFPNKVFQKEYDCYISFEFDVLFRNIFFEAVLNFCNVNDIEQIHLTSLDIVYHLDKIINKADIKLLLREILLNTKVPEAYPEVLTYYDLIRYFSVFASNFALYANRDFDIGLLGYMDGVCIEPFKKLAMNIPIRRQFEELGFNKVNLDKTARQFEGREVFFE